MDRSWLRQSVLPFLLLAYPLTFLFFQGGQFCQPLCFEPTAVGVTTLLSGLLVLMLVAGALGTRFRFNERGDTHRIVRWLGSPSLLAGGILVGVFVGFVGFLALDTLSLYEAVWKPIVLPFSFLLFLPVWVLYMASFPLAVLFSVAGIESSPLVTVVFRGVVVFIGFPLSAGVQTLFVSVVVERLQSEAID
ncbi:hypothetical protein HLRTI_003412 [Halorhabdus tiamatea SARL4B]|uniref:Uncharacterized protein n=2 Tax=Halobacteriales TaxID=2235 RepID=U2F7U8_9EURY|nr:MULTISPECIES: hypothetical protein [Halobacteria]ERJ04629.1 hypothetical protein HLRTI_003412 [Halorhabdus tiamatea SARL4B]